MNTPSLPLDVVPHAYDNVPYYHSQTDHFSSNQIPKSDVLFQDDHFSNDELVPTNGRNLKKAFSRYVPPPSSPPSSSSRRRTSGSSVPGRRWTPPVPIEEQRANAYKSSMFVGMDTIKGFITNKSLWSKMAGQQTDNQINLPTVELRQIVDRFSYQRDQISLEEYENSGAEYLNVPFLIAHGNNVFSIKVLYVDEIQRSSLIGTLANRLDCNPHKGWSIPDRMSEEEANSDATRIKYSCSKLMSLFNSTPGATKKGYIWIMKSAPEGRDLALRIVQKALDQKKDIDLLDIKVIIEQFNPESYSMVYKQDLESKAASGDVEDLGIPILTVGPSKKKFTLDVIDTNEKKWKTLKSIDCKGVSPDWKMPEGQSPEDMAKNFESQKFTQDYLCSKLLPLADAKVWENQVFILKPPMPSLPSTPRYTSSGGRTAACIVMGCLLAGAQILSHI